MSTILEVEHLARELHESSRLLTKENSINTNEKFTEWDDLADIVKESRRIQARYFLSKYKILDI